MSQSPKARPSQSNLTMDFPDAMREVIKGKKVTREGWDNDNYLFLEKPGFLMLHKDDGEAYILQVSDGDMLNDDWLVVSHH